MQSNPNRFQLPASVRTERLYNIADRRHMGQRFKRNGGRKPRTFRDNFVLAFYRKLW